MTAHLYDPLDPAYIDAVATRAERDRTFQVCADCRLCVRLCPSFKSLFSMIDERDAADHADAVDSLTDAEHRRVVDECYQCKLCYVVCPYTPDNQQEWVSDFPRLLLRSLAVQHEQGEGDRNARLLARTDLQGRVATTVAPLVNASNKVRFVRTLMEKATGVARDRSLPSFARQRFSTWFERRRSASTPAADAARDTVALFPTCLVEYQDPEIGKAAVAVFEHNGIGCELPPGQMCCGMPWLDAGDTEKFREHARRNVAALAPAVRNGQDVVVPQPTCGYVLKEEYPDFLGTDDARLVAEHTFDTSEYLMQRNRREPLDTTFPGPVPERITWQAACHYRAQEMGPKSRELLALTGAEVTTVERCSAIDGTWGLRAENVEMARKIAEPLMDAVRREGAPVAGDCHLANNAILEGTGERPLHPLQVMARAYGLAED